MEEKSAPPVLEQKSSRSEAKGLKPYLIDFERLFYGQADLSSPRSETDYGFASSAQDAIPHGTTLLLTGAPGAGKTIFALSFVRSLYVSLFPKGQPSAPVKDSGENLPILYYVSLEIFPEKLKEAVKAFGWLVPSDTIFQEGESGSLDRPTVRIITAAPEVDRPVPGAEELLSSIFAQISRAQAREDEQRKVIVIIDSLTALIRTRGDYSERRRQTHETIYRLKKMFQEGTLLLTILIAESETSESGSGDPGNMVEEYLADMVFRLGTHPLPLGRRLRTLEIPKSQGMNVVIGEHTWLIVTRKSINSLIEEENLKERICESANTTLAEPDDFGTVVILPRSRGFSRGLQEVRRGATELGPEGEAAEEADIMSGTPGLDAMLNYDPKDWLTEVPRAPEAGGLKRHSTTLLVGPAGSGKTGIGLQFLFEYWEEAAEPKCAPVLITFDYASAGVDRTIDDHWEKWVVSKNKLKKKAPERKVTALVFRQAHIDLNLVVAQVRQSILGDILNQPTGREPRVPQRLMIDGLSEWLSSFEGSEREQVLEALLNSIFEAREERNRLYENWRQTLPGGVEGRLMEPPPPPPLTIMICYEVEEGNAHAVAATFAIPAQNIFLIKQIPIQDKTRRVIYLAKAEGKNSDRAVREVRRFKRDGPLQILASLDEFNRVLTPDQIEPANVYLQFFAENSAERAWTSWAVKHLKGLKRLNYQTMNFGRVENSRTFEHAGGFGASPELRLISVDEWWIHAQGARGASKREASETNDAKGAKDLSKQDAGDKANDEAREGNVPMLDLTRLWSRGAAPTHQGLEGSWSDYWFFEVEKASARNVPTALRGAVTSAETKPANGKEVNPNAAYPEPICEGDSLYAVPAYMDFSLFCINLRQFRDHPWRGWEETTGEPDSLKQAIQEFDDWKSADDLKKKEDRTEHRNSERIDSKGQKSLRRIWHEASDAFPRSWVPAATGTTKEIMAAEESYKANLGTVREKSLLRSWRELQGWQPGIDYFEGLEEENPGSGTGVKESGKAKEQMKNPARVASLLELIPFRSRGVGLPKLFAVDTSTPESLCCVWFEMAWSFGATKEFLNPDVEALGTDGRFSETASAEEIQRLPETQALVFLQELVLRGLMPARATLEQTREAYFSRQWYSTISYLASDTREPDRLLPIPFWPVRADDAEAWVFSLREAVERFQRTIWRTCAALEAIRHFSSGETSAWALEREAKIQQWRSALDETVGVLRKKSAELDAVWSNRSTVAPRFSDSAVQTCVTGFIAELIERTKRYKENLEDETIKQCLQNPPAASDRSSGAKSTPAAEKRAEGRPRTPLVWPDYRDLIEIFQSHTFRMGLVIASLTEESEVIERAKLGLEAGTRGAFRAVLKLWRSNPYAIPLAERFLEKGLKYEGGEKGRRYASTLAGHGTSGSWLYSVHKRSLSLSLAKPLLEELTSLQAAEQRARLGAGLPSRKDFYATSGDEYAAHCENLSWRDLLRFCGSRCRERAAVVAPQDDILARFHLISERLLDLLQRAYDDRPQSAGEMGGRLEQALVRAEQFVREIRRSVNDRRENGGAEQRPETFR